MFIAMNRFRVARGRETEFEEVWSKRDTHLDGIAGFVRFLLLKGPESKDHTLYVSHSLWRDEAAFRAWTRSDAFRSAHADAGRHRHLYLGPPQFEGFEVILET